MPRQAKKLLRLFSDWEFVIRVKNNEQCPLLTTVDGIRHVMLQNGLTSEEAITNAIRRINTGIPFDSIIGDFTHIHKRMPLIIERLRQTAVGLQDKYYYCACWWHKVNGIVWWSYSADDTHIADFVLIKHSFEAHKEVNSVLFQCEALPDLRKDPRWVEVYPRRV